MNTVCTWGYTRRGLTEEVGKGVVGIFYLTRARIICQVGGVLDTLPTGSSVAVGVEPW